MDKKKEKADLNSAGRAFLFDILPNRFKAPAELDS